MPLYSEEIQDVMSQIPGRILRIGLTVIFMIMFLLIVGSYFFKYPDIVSCQIIMTTINPPLALNVKSSGKIEHLCVEEKQFVHSDELIAVIANTANYNDIKILDSLLSRLGGIMVWDSIVVRQKLNPNLGLGELQENYIQFCKGWVKFANYLQQKYLPIKIGLLKQQNLRKQYYYNDLEKQQKILYNDYVLTQNQYHRDSVFYHRYPDAVSLSDYEKNTQSYLQKSSSYINFCSSLKNAEMDMLKLEEEYIDLEILYEKELNEFRIGLDESYHLLLEAYNLWQERYIIRSSINGYITYTKYWSENQSVVSGDPLATIVPEGEMKVIGRAVVNMAGIGKIEKGQLVNIKLDGFPYLEYGMLKGEVYNISLVPGVDGYNVDILLNKGMLTSYQEELRFIHQMSGTAEIVTKDNRLLYKFINPLKYLVN